MITAPTRGPRNQTEVNLLQAIELAAATVKAQRHAAEAAALRNDIATTTAERDMLARRLAQISKGAR